MDGREPGREVGESGAALPDDVPPPTKPPTVGTLVDELLAAPPVRPPGFHAAFDRLIQGPRSAFVVWTFGIVAPPVLLWVERPLAAEWDILPLRPFSSLLAFASVAVLVLWRILGNRANGWDSALFAGACAAATCGAAAVGTMLLGEAVLGLLHGHFLGLLGLVPFLTAWVFFGATLESLRRALGRATLHRVAFFALVGGCAVVGGSWAGGRLALRLERRYVSQIAVGSESPRARPVLRLLWWFPGVRLRELEGSPIDIGNFEVRGGAGVVKRLRDAYREITGLEPPYR